MKKAVFMILLIVPVIVFASDVVKVKVQKSTLYEEPKFFSRVVASVTYGDNMELLEHVNASGEVFLSHTKLDDGVALRVAIGNLGTVETDVARCQELLKEGLECLSSR